MCQTLYRFFRMTGSNAHREGGNNDATCDQSNQEAQDREQNNDDGDTVPTDSDISDDQSVRYMINYGDSDTDNSDLGDENSAKNSTPARVKKNTPITVRVPKTSQTVAITSPTSNIAKKDHKQSQNQTRTRVTILQTNRALDQGQKLVLFD